MEDSSVAAKPWKLERLSALRNPRGAAQPSALASEAATEAKGHSPGARAPENNSGEAVGGAAPGTVTPMASPPGAANLRAECAPGESVELSDDCESDKASEGGNGVGEERKRKRVAAGAAPSILAIDKASVHRICSGQVVLDMAVAVKELVENAIDAGASEVEVALEQDGLQCMEVRDNGSGIAEKDHQAVTLKHYTSKLRDFSDLDSVGTLGFRGEALSSLCALCHSLRITTRTDEADTAVTLSYDKDGMLTGKSHTTRPVGTTVRVEEIFSSAPVRRQALLKSRKKEYYKLVALVQQYAVSHVDVRFRMTNVTKSRQIVISTSGAGDVYDAVVSVFGLKFAKNLKPVSLRADRFTCAPHRSGASGSV